MGRFQLSGTLSLAAKFLWKGVICLLAALWLMGQCCLKQMEINLGRKKIFFFSSGGRGAVFFCFDFV